MVNTKYFENRQTLDRLFLGQFLGIEAKIEQFGRVSIRNAILMCNVEISCDMDFYLQHPNEIEMDLNRSVDVCLIKDDIESLKRLEEELFYNQMCSLFGDDVDDFLEDDEDDQSGNNDKFKSQRVCNFISRWQLCLCFWKTRRLLSIIFIYILVILVFLFHFCF